MMPINLRIYSAGWWAHMVSSMVCRGPSAISYKADLFMSFPFFLLIGPHSPKPIKSMELIVFTDMAEGFSLWDARGSWKYRGNGGGRGRMALPGSKVLRRCQSKPVYLECLVTKVSAEMKEHKMYLKLEN